MTIYYLDNNNGNDSNDGLTPQTPWKELTKIATITPGAGDQFLLEASSEWNYPISTRVVIPSGAAGTENNPVIIDRYYRNAASIGRKPTIQWNYKIKTTDWTYSAPNNAWVYVAPFSVGSPCLVRINDTWLASSLGSASLPLAGVNGRYTNSGTSFYLYAPSTTNPTSYYGEVLLSLTDTGFFTVSSGRGWVKFRNLKFKNTGAGILVFSGTASPVGVTIEHCEADTVSRVFASASDTVGQLYLTILNNYITNYGSCAIQPINTGGAGGIRCEIAYNRIINGGYGQSQGAIYLQARSPGQIVRVHNNYIYGAVRGTLGKPYDGCAIYTETGSDNVLVYQNIIENCYLAFIDNSGRTTRWFSNLLLNCHSAMWTNDDLNIGLRQHYFYNNTCLVGNTNLQPAAGLPLDNYGWIDVIDVGSAGNLYIVNNVFYALTSYLAPDAAIRLPNIGYTGTIEDNAIYNFSAEAKLNYTPFTPVVISGTITADPLISRTSGEIIDSSSPIKWAGTQLNVMKDVLGHQFHFPPSMGAVEYSPPRVART